MNEYWSQYQKRIGISLGNSAVTDRENAPIEFQSGIDLLCEWARALAKGRRSIHFLGNGASACMASHMALDWIKNGGVRATAYNDVAYLTAIGNDLGYSRVFADPIMWHGREGDLLVTISSSGNSHNILEAINSGRKKGMRVATLSGMKADNASRRAGDLNFFVPGWSYGIIECAHQVILHAWLDSYMNVQEWELTGPQVISNPYDKRSSVEEAGYVEAGPQSP